MFPALGIAFIAALIARMIVWVIAAPVHEFSHALVADRLGDSTPERQGRLTLNPLAHLEPLGTLLVAIAGFGWAKPVQVNPYYLRHGSRMGMLLVSLAGPLSNLVLAVLFAVPVRLGLIQLNDSITIGPLPSLGMLWFWAIYLNLILMLFNLLPISPLDGFKILLGLLPPDMADSFARTEQWGIFILLALMILPTFNNSFISLLIGGPVATLFRLLTGV